MKMEKEFEKEIKLLNELVNEYKNEVEKLRKNDYRTEFVKELESRKLLPPREKVEEFLKNCDIRGKTFLIIYKSYLGELYTFLKQNLENFQMRQSQKGHFIVLEEESEGLDYIYTYNILHRLVEKYKENFKKESIIMRNIGVYTDTVQKRKTLDN
jgi:hypothetical protein